MTHHRLIETRPVAVVHPIHLVTAVGVAKLEQPAVGAPDELERPLRHLRSALSGEHTRQGLTTETEDREETRAPTYAASGYLSGHANPFRRAQAPTSASTNLDCPFNQSPMNEREVPTGAGETAGPPDSGR